MAFMVSEIQQQKQRIHPHKFTLWVAMGSIVMMFAGLTSAYIVRRNQANWLEFEMPKVFIYSTIAIILSSITIHLAQKSFKAREMSRYRILVVVTAVLGVVFTILQFKGFSQIEIGGVQLFGMGSNPSASFLGIITGLHILHVIGGVVALAVIMIRAFYAKTKTYSSTNIEIAATYWHFVDVLWIYLFIFFNFI
jgi:cytochrome c oxidase subunit 3